MNSKATAWDDALTAAALLAIDPKGLGGVLLRSAPSPTRDAWVTALKQAAPEAAPYKRVPINIDNEQLLGGIDLVATLAAGRPVERQGLFGACAGGVLFVASAERCAPNIAAYIAAELDRRRFAVVAFDEGRDDEEAAPAALRERLGIQFDLSGVRTTSRTLDRHDIDAARARLSIMPAIAEHEAEMVCQACVRFDIGSARAAMFTVRAARAAAAFAGRGAPSEEDWALAARLVLSPRARATQETAEESAPPENEAEAPEQSTQGSVAAERMVDAVRSALPARFLDDAFGQRRQRAEARQSGAGAAAKSARRGRPAGARPGTLRAGDRLDLVATLRAASVWQTFRRREHPRSEAMVLIQRQDFRIRRHVQRLESSIVFAVDASGSTALQRLAEAKGAVETLLADAYVTRAHVALIVFRDREAKVVLAPTRSLTRAKRALAELPGGGATPLASAIDAASLLAQGERTRGRSPLVVLLSDGRANVDRTGAALREPAGRDAVAAARMMRGAGLASVFIDTSQRPRREAQALAAAMGARYAALPHVHAHAVADIVKSHASMRQ